MLGLLLVDTPPAAAAKPLLADGDDLATDAGAPPAFMPDNALGLFLEGPAWVFEEGPSLTIPGRYAQPKVDPAPLWGVVDLPPDLPPPPLVVQAQPAAHTTPAPASAGPSSDHGHDAQLHSTVRPQPVADATTGEAGST